MNFEEYFKNKIKLTLLDNENISDNDINILYNHYISLPEIDYIKKEYYRYLREQKINRIINEKL